MLRRSSRELDTHERGFLLFDVLHQLSRTDFPTVYVSLVIHSYALRRTGPFHLERIRNAVQDLAVCKTSNPDSSLPPWVWGHTVRLGVGDIDHVTADVDAARAAKLLPFTEIIPVLIEDLNPHVSPVGNKELPL